MHRNAAELVVHQLALAGMHSYAAPPSPRRRSSPTTAHAQRTRARRPVEGREKAVACGIDFASAKLRELLAYQGVVIP